jgi:hypothetical protein
MGNNAAFTSFEASVLAVYNKGVLDKELLDALAKPYEDTDIDRGGMTGDLAKDGLDIDGIVLKIYGIELPPKPDLPKHRSEWTQEQEKANDAWYDLQCEALQSIEKAWGWR